MKRSFNLILLICLCSILWGCSNKASAPSSPSNSGGGATAFTYPFAGQIGSYFNETTLEDPSCSVYYPAPAEFWIPFGVAASGDYLFISDPQFGDIQVFTTSGTYITAFWPDDSSGDIANGGGNPVPAGLTVDKQGHLYETDPNLGVINVFNINDILAQAPAVWPCGFLSAYATYRGINPIDVSVDNNGNMYVADDGNGLEKIAPNFNDTTVGCCGYNSGDNWLASTSGGYASINGGSLASPIGGGIVVTADGSRVYYGDAGNNVIQVYDSGLNPVGFIGNAGGAATTAAGEFDGPIGVILDNQGNLLVTEEGNARVQRLTTGGTFLAFIGWGASHTTPQPGDIASPILLAVDSNDDLFVSNPSVSGVYKYSSH